MPQDPASQNNQPGQQPERPNNHWPLMLLMVFGFYYVMTQLLVVPVETISYSQFLDNLETDRIASVQMRGQQLQGRYRTGSTEVTGQGRFDFRTVVPNVEDHSLIEKLNARGVEIHVQPDQAPGWLQALVGFIPWLLIFALFFYSSRMLRGRMGGAFEPGRSRARRYEKLESGPGFEQVAGLERAKRDLQEVIDYLREPERFQALGAHMPRGILMMGPPGTGKTLLARATAAEAGVPFFSISASEFIELFVGVGASRVREMFNDARKEAPSLIFIDEIDSVGRTRGTGLGGGHDEREQTLNQILAEMDGFEAREPVVVIAATNRPDVLDPALLRPGRFDRKVVLELPQRQARLEILRVHTDKVPLASDIDLEAIAASTVGFSGADLENLVNEAALRAARHRRDQVELDDFNHARDKVMMGERRDDLLNPNERQRVASHEAGHAITAYYSEHSDPVEKVSIIPRGRALGMTEQRPEQDRHNLDEVFLRERLSILLGGRCAEQLLFDSVSSGAADDLKQATQLARRMVAQWGMSESLGPASFNVGEEHPFLGRELSQPRDFSERTAEQMDREVMAMLQHAETLTTELLQRHRSALEQLVDALLDHETLEKAEIEQLLRAAAN